MVSPNLDAPTAPIKALSFLFKEHFLTPPPHEKFFALSTTVLAIYATYFPPAPSQMPS
jgi:hypothetical protein